MKIIIFLNILFIIVGIGYNIKFAENRIKSDIQSIENKEDSVRTVADKIKNELENSKFFKENKINVFINFTVYRVFVGKEPSVSFHFYSKGKNSIAIDFEKSGPEIVRLVQKNKELLPYLNNASTLSQVVHETDRTITIIYRYHETRQKFEISEKKPF